MAQSGQNLATGTAQAGQESSSTWTALEAPFAKVNSVVPGSPAESAGLKVGDNITKFGWVDWTNHDKLSKVAEAVTQNEGVSCPLDLSATVFSCDFHVPGVEDGVLENAPAQAISHKVCQWETC
jgi:C-terminal processing protease CtpA/Prc